MSTKKKNGISLRTIHTLLIVFAFILSGLMLYSTYYVSVSFKNVTEKSEKHLELQNAAVELMDASNYMTEKVHRFVISGEIKFLNDYYNEAFLNQRREDAIATMASDDEAKGALEKLQKAMDGSQELMKTEYYAIKLVVEAQGYKSSPVPLDDVEISAEDEALSAEGKMRRASEIVFGDDYYAQKYLIHEYMQESIDEINEYVNNADKAALNEMRDRIMALRSVIVLETIGMFFLVWLASRLGIHPIIKAVDRIKNDNKIAESGTTEFRYLVRAYNQMYDMYRASLKHMSFKASHDELTGVYNRTGYEQIISEIDFSSTYVLLIDLDNFKWVNDTFGHETGDRVLTKLVRVLQNNFRPDDFICRIGGDEFVVFMLHSPEKRDDIIANKIEKINRELGDTEDGLPSISISVGIVHGSQADEVDELLKKTDVAMYESKQKGKQTYTFYNE